MLKRMVLLVIFVCGVVRTAYAMCPEENAQTVCQVPQLKTTGLVVLPEDLAEEPEPENAEFPFGEPASRQPYTVVKGPGESCWCVSYHGTQITGEGNRVEVDGAKYIWLAEENYLCWVIMLRDGTSFVMKTSNGRFLGFFDSVAEVNQGPIGSGKEREYDNK